MSETPDAGTHTTPRHVWVVGGIALLWNAFGAMDYVMTQTKNEAYMSSFTPEQLEFFYGFPAWVVAAWAIAVWGGVVGSVLLLVRKRFAVQAFLASLIGMVITTFHNYVLSSGFEVAGDFVLSAPAEEQTFQDGSVAVARRILNQIRPPGWPA